jgi:polyhydroxybutyrate depolymerase
MQKNYTLTFAFLFFSLATFAQLDSIYDQNAWRTFIVHLPTNYNASNQYPLVLNLHGYNSDAAQQQSYSQFDNVADTAGFIVVYPDGINNAWAINNNTDVDFLTHLVDTIRNRHSCTNCLFVTGMSDGGFMTYKFACAAQIPIKAIAVGSGNMSRPLQNSCTSANQIPVMHFHGTADPLVNYNGVAVIAPVDTTIAWWVNHNNCNATPSFTAIPDINTSDSCSVEKYQYTGGSNNTEVIFYKVLNGGHTWSSATPAPPLGNTNYDINQSALIASFFKNICSYTTDLETVSAAIDINIYPNPASHLLTVEAPQQNFELIVIDAFGRNVMQQNINGKALINCGALQTGLYFVQLNGEGVTLNKKFLVAH